MENIITWFTAHWDKVLILLIFAQNTVKGLRDALDTTPESDDNVFEKTATIITKVIGYLLGFRPKAKVVK